MALTPFKVNPGIDRESTNYANKGGWFSGDKIRFRAGLPEKIGGWVKYTTAAFLGKCRALFNWISLDSSNWMAVGTDLKYYVEKGGTFFDITPIRRSVTLGTDPFASTSGSAHLVVTDAGHGAVDGDFVTFSGATTFAGIPAVDLNREFQIFFLTANTYRITVATAANATTTGGGAAVNAAYQINIGQASASAGDGWGSGTWGRGTWGSGSAVFVPTSQLRVWSQTNFGEDLIFNTRNSSIYYWDTSIGPGTRAVNLTTLGGASNVPTVANFVLFGENRHLTAYGCNPIGSAIQDPMFIRWATQESLVNWTPDATNSAGGQRLAAGSYLVGALKMKQEVLVWTDANLYSQQYTGSPYFFSFDLLAHNISIAGPNAAAAVGDTVFWMGQDKFYVYGGRVQTLPCSLQRHVFEDINNEQLYQVYCSTNEGFNEVIWFYPSMDSLVNDRYVIYNHLQNLWYYGTLQRTAWIDSPLRSQPQAAGNDGYLYYHEIGLDDGSTTPVSPINAYIESSDIDLGEGNAFMFIQRVVPDVSFVGSTGAVPSVALTIRARRAPGTNYLNSDIATTTRSATVPVEQFTEQVWIRLRGRQASVRVESTATGVQWQLGTPRFDLRADGKR